MARKITQSEFQQFAESTPHHIFYWCIQKNCLNHGCCRSPTMVWFHHFLSIAALALAMQKALMPPSTLPSMTILIVILLAVLPHKALLNNNSTVDAVAIMGTTRKKFFLLFSNSTCQLEMPCGTSFFMISKRPFQTQEEMLNQSVICTANCPWNTKRAKEIQKMIHSINAIGDGSKENGGPRDMMDEIAANRDSSNKETPNNNGPKLNGPAPMTTKQGNRRGNINNNLESCSLIEVMICQQQMQAECDAAERRAERIEEHWKDQKAERWQECHNRMMFQFMMVGVNMVGGLMQDRCGGAITSADIACMATLDSDNSMESSNKESNTKLPQCKNQWTWEASERRTLVCPEWRVESMKVLV